jgi:hypothetical protein
MFRLLPAGFANRDLRRLLTDLLGTHAITAGQMSYDLRRLRVHGLITHHYLDPARNSSVRAAEPGLNRGAGPAVDLPQQDLITSDPSSTAPSRSTSSCLQMSAVLTSTLSRFVVK